MLTLTLATLIFTATAAAATGPRITTRIAETIVDTWRCQDQLGIRRTKAASPWKPHSQAYRRWVLIRWQQRRTACVSTLNARGDMIRRLNDGIGRYYRSQGRGSGPLSGQGPAIEQAARRHRLSPYFLVATSVTESSMGLAACRNNRMNIWGLASCTGSWGGTRVPTWRTWAEAFDWYARFLTGRTPVTTGWPHARSPYDYSGYAACSPCWGRKTADHMRRIFGVEPEVRYP